MSKQMDPRALPRLLWLCCAILLTTAGDDFAGLRREQRYYVLQPSLGLQEGLRRSRGTPAKSDTEEARLKFNGPEPNVLFLVSNCTSILSQGRNTIRNVAQRAIKSSMNWRHVYTLVAATGILNLEPYMGSNRCNESTGCWHVWLETSQKRFSQKNSPWTTMNNGGVALSSTHALVERARFCIDGVASRWFRRHLQIYVWTVWRTNTTLTLTKTLPRPSPTRPPLSCFRCLLFWTYT